MWGWMNICARRPWWQLGFHARKHTQAHTSKDGEMSLCKHTQSAHTKRKYISMCLRYMTLSAYQSSLQRKAAVESAAMKCRQDPLIVGANMKALSYEERERGWRCKNERTELSTNSNVNCTGLHNLRLMRKQRQIKSPSFYPDWLCSTGALFIKKASEAAL